MSGTFSKVFLQVVIAVDGRENLIRPEWKEELNRYISGIIRSREQKPIIVNGVSDHIHAFIGLNPSMRISDLVMDIKTNSCNFINAKGGLKKKFNWQAGYGVFSYAETDINRVYNYILHQEHHHRNKTFKEEYRELLDEFGIDYEEKYLFDWIDHHFIPQGL